MRRAESTGAWTGGVRFFVGRVLPGAGVGRGRRGRAVVVMGLAMAAVWWPVSPLAREGGSGGGGEARAALQDGGSNSDWKRAYDDVVGQLKAAQDRRNELAAENERLQKRLAEAEKRLAPLAARNVELEREAGEYAARTYDLRLLKARVDLLLQVHPEVRRKWQQVLQGEAAPESLGFLSRRWPLRED